MSTASTRPPVPRPTTKPVPSARPPSAVESSPVLEIRKAYKTDPPIIRERFPTLEIVDEDVLSEDAVASPRATPPPAPPAPPVRARKKTTLPDPLLVLEPARTGVAPKRAPAPLAKAAPLAKSVPAAPAPRVESGLEPMDVLFDGIYELEFVDTPWAAAAVCAAALARALGARAVVVHSHDVARRELRAIGTHGAAWELLGTTEASDDDLVASAVICNEKAVTMRWGGELPRVAPRRFSVVGAPRTLVAVPAMAWGRCIAIIEIVDADERFASRVADAASYVAERLAEFISSRAAA